MPTKKRKLKSGVSQARKRVTANKVSETSDAVPFEHKKTPNDKPCYEAFGITEILESILECLPPDTLHAIRRVNKRFQNVIVNSPRIQRRLFLRIDDKPGTLWTFHQPVKRRIGKIWCLTEAGEADIVSEDLLTQVEINPCLVLSEGYKDLVCMHFSSKTKQALKRGLLVRFPFGRTSTLQQIGQQTWQQDSISRSLISDPHCPKIEVVLSFALGVRRPTMIYVCSVVESDTPLTIRAIISRALNTRGSIKIVWRGDGYTAANSYEPREGVPRDLMNELKSRSRLEVYFWPRYTIFLLNGTMALTDKERAIIESRQFLGVEDKLSWSSIDYLSELRIV